MSAKFPRGGGAGPFLARSLLCISLFSILICFKTFILLLIKLMVVWAGNFCFAFCFAVAIFPHLK